MIFSSDLKALRSENIHKFEIITRLTVEGNIQTFHYKLKISLVHCQEKKTQAENTDYMKIQYKIRKNPKLKITSLVERKG
ncbi:hypothetical protein L2E82_07883 [Cichorium intybus]|uniref:Uncharacterized protein n=1 Tax=Cichorium intybus TaxID=13427 RepID=A0ACB9G5N0_CICIN|nr:hypothetical protein L2E82_07883 [Cichorium intybus]